MEQRLQHRLRAIQRAPSQMHQRGGDKQQRQQYQRQPGRD
jgi:hypothetical protein